MTIEEGSELLKITADLFNQYNKVHEKIHKNPNTPDYGHQDFINLIHTMQRQIVFEIVANNQMLPIIK